MAPVSVVLLTVEFCVLLEGLFLAGVMGKCWRLIHQSTVKNGVLLTPPTSSMYR